jgi:hypothetical protein
VSGPPYKGLEPGTAPTIPTHPKHGPEEVAYTYVDRNGVPLFAVCRYATSGGKTFLQGRPGASGAGWAWNLRGVEPVLYRLDEVAAHLEAGSPAPLYIVEGEKACDRLREHLRERELPGVVTTSPMGAGKWRESYTDELQGARHVIVVADLDEPGRRHALAVARALRPVVDRLEVRRPAIDVEHAGVDDHLDAGKSLDELLELEAPPEESAVELRFVPAADFIRKDEPSAEPLLGDDDDVVIARDGTMIAFGDGGAGKTTTVVDLVVHLAAGVEWHGLPVERPVRIGLIENEGPRGLFRRKLRRKAEGWEGKPFLGNVYVLEEPWARTSFGLDEHRAELARWIRELELDLIVAGPMKNLGTVGGGTFEDVNVFAGHLAAIRAAVGRDLAFLLVHHENAAGEISGAWEGEPDTLLHVKQGHGERTVLLWEKVRWSSRLHGKKMVLAWAPAEAFEVVEGPEGKPDRDLRTELLELAESRRAGEWRTLKEWSASKSGGIGADEPPVRAALEGLTTDGLFAYSEDPKVHGRAATAKCWSYCGEGSPQSTAVGRPGWSGGGDCGGAVDVREPHQTQPLPHPADCGAASTSPQSRRDEADELGEDGLEWR